MFITGNEEQITIKKRIIAEEGIGLPICHYIYIYVCMYVLSRMYVLSSTK